MLGFKTRPLATRLHFVGLVVVGDHDGRRHARRDLFAAVIQHLKIDTSLRERENKGSVSMTHDKHEYVALTKSQGVHYGAGNSM